MLQSIVRPFSSQPRRGAIIGSGNLDASTTNSAVSKSCATRSRGVFSTITGSMPEPGFNAREKKNKGDAASVRESTSETNKTRTTREPERA